MAAKAFTIPSSLKTPTSTTTIITGGSSGIGLATALHLHTLSPTTNKILLLDRNPPPPSSLPSTPSAKTNITYIACDITSWQSQLSAFKSALSHSSNQIDHVFVNAGIAEHKDQFFTDEYDSHGDLIEPDRRTIDVDIRAAGDTIKLAVWCMRRNKKRKGGSIVMTASLAGYLASAGAPLYSAAKHGIVGLMRALKNDLATLDISCSVVAPGITLTDIVSGRKEGQSLRDWAVEMRGKGVPINDPGEVAAAVVWLMGLGMAANGKGLVIQAGRCADVEAGIAKSRNVWMGEEMLMLFRGGREAPLFPNKL